MNDERARHLFEALGLKPEDLPEPVPPTEEEVRQRVGELLVIDAVMWQVEASSPHEAARRISRHQRSQLESPLNELFTWYCAQDDVTQRIYAFVLENPQHFKR